MKKDAKFEWTSACHKSFELLKEALCGEPILKYADTSKPYTLYTDASKFGWAGVLTQPHMMTIDGKSTTTDHPVAFVSGLFRGSQLNWAALANGFLLVFAVSGPFTSFLVLHTVSWFSRSEACAFVWGIFVRGLRVETFVRVLRSSRVVL